MSNLELMYKDLIAFHPGSYIKEIIEDLNLTQAEFAKRLGSNTKTVSKVVNGEDRVTPNFAELLYKLTGVSIQTWLNLQANFDSKKKEIEILQDNDEEEIIDIIDFGYFKKNNLVENKRYSRAEKIGELRKLLSLSKLSILHEFNSAVSYRNTQNFTEKSIVNSNIMLELAIRKARNNTAVKLDKNKLENMLPEIRKMTTMKPEIFYPKLEELLLKCGVVLVGLSSISNANLNGATKKFSDGSVLLLITDRNKSSDIFWFSLFHELAHILKNDFYSDYDNVEEYINKENVADQFARDYLISSECYEKFVRDNKFNVNSVVEFSKEIDIHPSIVVGRLQNDGYIGYSELSTLKSQYAFV